MRNLKRTLALLLSVALLLSAGVRAAENDGGALDYGDRANWAYFEADRDKDVDVFLICPTVDTRSERNSFDLNEKLKKNFVNALDMEKGIYDETGRMFAPYYRQMSMNAYKLPQEERAQAQKIAYEDVSAAFRWYLDHENGGRGLILAGFSQGGQMCLELLKEYFGGEEGRALREKLISVYAIGWSVTEEMTQAYPQIVPAKGETDVGSVVSFDCEDGTLTDTLVIPAGTKALSVNPLNWKTDGTPADKSLNRGAVMSTGAEPVPGLCGAYIGARGELVVTDVTPKEYPAVIDIFPDGSYHIYDYLFFFTNLKENVAARTAAWRTGTPFKDVAEGTWYTGAVAYAYRNGLMAGTGATSFSPDAQLTRAQLVTILWKLVGAPEIKLSATIPDVEDGAWYAAAAHWAIADGIVDRSTGESFDPEEALTREETAQLLWRCARYLGVDVSVGEDTNILSYNDFNEIGKAYIPAVQWAVGADVMTGAGGGMLMPKGRLTRAQAAVMLQKFGRVRAAQMPLSLWTEDAPAKAALIAYVEAVTDTGSEDYIPVEDRIAVFDLDGTLFCETDPNYFDYTLLAYRVLEDPDYKDKASEFEREVAGKIREQNATGASFAGLEVDHGKAVASAFAGMTVAQFNEYIQSFKQQPMPSYEGMSRGDGFYLPMVQVVEYLQENEFTVYIVSGTDRLIVRGIVDGSVLNIPNRQIIGSDETIVAGKQGDADGLDYVFTDGDELILGGQFLIKNLKMNKVSVIMQEIGQQPVLSFGNSTGDSSMAEYVTSGNRYRSLAFMLCCDDTARENGNVAKADKMRGLCAQYDWVPVSMRDDWTTIYGEGVTYHPSAPAEQPAA